MATKKNTTLKSKTAQETNLKSALNVPASTEDKTVEKKRTIKQLKSETSDKTETPRKSEIVKPLKKEKVTKEKKEKKIASPPLKGKRIVITKKDVDDLPPIATVKVKAPTKKTTTKELPSAQHKPLAITFQLRFTSQVGQAIYIVGNHDLLGNNEPATAIPLQYFNNEFWFVTISLNDSKSIDEPINYRYIIRYEDGTVSMELGNDKQLKPSGITASELLIIDSWNYPGYYENTFYTEPFTQILLKNNVTEILQQQPSSYTHTFKIKAPLVPADHIVCLSGSIPQLGLWSPDEVLLMDKKPEGAWYSVNVDIADVKFPIAYKYGGYNVVTKQLITLEEGNNRILYDITSPEKLTILADGFIKLPNTTFKGAGIAIPVFSLRSKNGLGVGEFSDLKVLVDWVKQVGLKVIQILPVNDTSATHTTADSYPYAAISAFALHPGYLNLPSIISEENASLLSEIDDLRVQLNQTETLDYQAVMTAKLEFIKKIFPLQKQTTFSSEDFNSFFTTNAHWLVPYAAFCYLRDEYETADFTQWLTHNSFDVFEVNALATPVLTAKDEISIHYFIQYHLHLQLKSATEYAHANGIIVKGDIPIGIFRNSCDAWQQPQLYNMNMQAGAPPDDFAIKGQNWGFPTYNWQRMAEDGFTWWKNRFEQMSYYFDAFRIDHILGFFRIWSIPMNAVEGIMGYFVPAIPVHINEFHERGIWFDHYRYTKPFINDSVLYELFGANAETAITKFLQKNHLGMYELLPAFDTQRKVADHFASLEVTNENQSLQQGLFDLISNVLLFEVEGSEGQQYHFRIAAENTTSFRYLDEGTKYQIKDLYVNYFYRRQDNFWMKEAMQKLPELKRSTNMLICGEDLGMVPDCVPGVMKDLGILSLEIQRMPKDPSSEFFHPNDAPYMSVVTPSTHDMSTIRGWWEEDRAKTQRFYNNQLGQFGNAPYFCEPWINKAIVLQHLYSPAMWSIFQIQDILGMSALLRRQSPADERINIPADPKHYWRYRMHINLEDLIEEKEFNTELSDYIRLCGR